MLIYYFSKISFLSFFLQFSRVIVKQLSNHLLRLLLHFKNTFLSYIMQL